MKPVINDSCIACGTCEGLCPEVFKVAEVDGKMIATVLEADYAALESKIDEAIAACPVQAISKE
ncbi:MAG: Ferredoxin-1 [Parcubacteria group bacterium ADurb.Bin326]|nr:MAG: Ferredoxin-1 [Parcubacteria group bacterium ADurb.Bin326]